MILNGTATRPVYPLVLENGEYIFMQMSSNGLWLDFYIQDLNKEDFIKYLSLPLIQIESAKNNYRGNE